MKAPMPLSEPVEDLLAAMAGSSLAAFATELRAYLEEGVPSERMPLERIISDEHSEVQYRHRTPREQVIDACAFISDQLIEPYAMIGEAERLAGDLSEGRSIGLTPVPVTIALVDERFEDSEPSPLLTKEELAAARDLATSLPGARRLMLHRLGEEEDSADPVPSPDAPSYGTEEELLASLTPTRQTEDRRRRFVADSEPPPIELIKHELGIEDQSDAG